MRKPFFVGCLLATISLSLLSTSLLNAEPKKLNYKGVEFPVAINFPAAVKQSHSVLPNSTEYYAFSAEDQVSSQAYATTITIFPDALGKITREIAQEVVSQSLQTQIETVNAATGIKGEVIKENSASLGGYPSKYITLVRGTNPKFFSCYRCVFIDRCLVVSWSMGLDTKKNHNLAMGFIQSLQVVK